MNTTRREESSPSTAVGQRPPVDEPPNSLRTGDTLPRHVAILEGRDNEGRIHVYDVHALDEPFLGFFFATNLYPEWRTRIETQETWKAEQAAGSSPILKR